MYTTKVSAKGWIVIPKHLREKYGLKKGTQVRVVDYGEELALVPLPADPVGALHGMLEGGPPLTEELLAERTRERAREESRHG
jgi:AbrB family looped-hinge helix DNA binding protein